MKETNLLPADLCLRCEIVVRRYAAHGMSSRLVQSLAGEEVVHPPLALQTYNCVIGWISQMVERQQLGCAGEK